MRKFISFTSKLSTVLTLIFLVSSINVNAMEIGTKAITCCDKMNTVVTTEKKSGPVYGCTEHNRCTYFNVDVYNIKKCLSCNAVYYRNHSYSYQQHTY